MISALKEFVVFLRRESVYRSKCSGRPSRVKTELGKLAELAGIWQLQTWESTKGKEMSQAGSEGGKGQRLSIQGGGTWKILAEKQMDKVRTDFRGARMLNLKLKNLFSEMEIVVPNPFLKIFLNIEIKFIVSFLYLFWSTYVLGTVLNAL